MLRRVIVLGLLLSGLTLTIAAFAKTKEGYYFGGQAGLGGPDIRESISAGIKRDDYGFVGRFYGGVLWKINASFQGALEAGVSDYQKRGYTFGGSDDNRSEFNYRGYYFDLLGVFRYEALPKWDILAKFGIAYVIQRTESSGQSFAKEFEKVSSKDTLRPKIAAGIAYNISDRFSIDLTLSYVFGRRPILMRGEGKHNREEANKAAPINSVMLGVSYHI